MKLETLATSQQASVGEHVESLGVERPVRAFAGTIGTSRNFHKAIVEAQIVPQRVLPSLCVRSVVGKSVCDVSAKSKKEEKQ